MSNLQQCRNFFAVKWETFVTIELCRDIEDTVDLQKIQKNIVDGELRRIAAATEALGDGIPEPEGARNRLRTI